MIVQIGCCLSKINEDKGRVDVMETAPKVPKVELRAATPKPIAVHWTLRGQHIGRDVEDAMCIHSAPTSAWIFVNVIQFQPPLYKLL